MLDLVSDLCYNIVKFRGNSYPLELSHNFFYLLFKAKVVRFIGGPQPLDESNNGGFFYV